MNDTQTAALLRVLECIIADLPKDEADYNPHFGWHYDTHVALDNLRKALETPTPGA